MAPWSSIRSFSTGTALVKGAEAFLEKKLHTSTNPTCARVKSQYMASGHPTFNRASLYKYTYIYISYIWAIHYKSFTCNDLRPFWVGETYFSLPFWGDRSRREICRFYIAEKQNVPDCNWIALSFGG